MSLDEQLPVANWPTVSGEYKVVQLELDGHLYLRFPEEDRETHATILDKLFSHVGVKYDTILSANNYDVPALSGERYKVYGMGKSQINVEQKEAYFDGISSDYMIIIDAAHLESLRPLVNDWKLKS